MYDFSGAFSGHQSFVVPVKVDVVSDSERSLEQASELMSPGPPRLAACTRAHTRRDWTKGKIAELIMVVTGIDFDLSDLLRLLRGLS